MAALEHEAVTDTPLVPPRTNVDLQKLKNVEAAIFASVRDTPILDNSCLTEEEVAVLAECIKNSSVLKPVGELLQKDLVEQVRRLRQQVSRNRPGSARNKVRAAKKRVRDEQLKVGQKRALQQMKLKHAQSVKKLEETIKTLREKQKQTCVKLKVASASSAKSRPRCDVEGCYNVARGKSKKCIGHGGGPRCTYKGCNSGALSASLGFCGKHAISSAQEVIVCSKCNKEFRSLEGLRSHTKNKVCEKAESLESAYKHACDMCIRKFKSGQGLAYHKKIVHEAAGNNNTKRTFVYDATKLLENVKKSRLGLKENNEDGDLNSLEDRGDRQPVEPVAD